MIFSIPPLFFDGLASSCIFVSGFVAGFSCVIKRRGMACFGAFWLALVAVGFPVHWAFSE